MNGGFTVPSLLLDGDGDSSIRLLCRLRRPVLVPEALGRLLVGLGGGVLLVLVAGAGAV